MGEAKEPAGMEDTRFTEQLPISDIVAGYEQVDGAWQLTQLDTHLFATARCC